MTFILNNKIVCVVCELWGASTKHADVIYSMNRDIEIDLFRRCQFADDPDHDIFQWLLYVASRQTWKNTAIKIPGIALGYAGQDVTTPIEVYICSKCGELMPEYKAPKEEDTNENKTKLII